MSRSRGVGVGIVGILVVGAVIAVGLARKGGRGPEPATTAAAPAQEPASHAEPEAGDLAEGLRNGSGPALARLSERFTPAVEGEGQAAPPAVEPLSPEEAEEAVALLDALRIGFGKYNAAGKVAAIEAIGQILQRFTAEATPTSWSRALRPAFEGLAAGLADRDPTVRVAACDLIAGLWVFAPGCTMTPAEEAELAAWKEGFHPLVVRRLEDAESACRAAAIRCLGRLPIDEAAAPAVAGIRDGDFQVRYQTLVAFADRPRLLTDEAILPLLHDPVPDLGGLAERVLKARGLSQEQVGLGRLVSHARPDIRASAIPLLLKRDDIDPIVWLLHLTEDADASVRLQAVRALEGRITAEARQRLREMAAADESEEVRAAAARLAPAGSDQTVALPPLPGSPSLNLRAN